MAAQIEVKELNKIILMKEDELELEFNTSATIEAQLKDNERKYLVNREHLREELDEALKNKSDDVQIRQAIKRNDEDIVDNEKEILANASKKNLISALRKNRRGETETEKDLTRMLERISLEGRLKTAEDRDPRREDNRGNKKIIGKMPEYSLKEDFDLFLQKFNTYTSLNQITDDNERKLLMDTAIADQAKQRCGYITALNEPYLSQTFSQYAKCLKERFYPKARSLLYKAGYDHIVQKKNQNIQDYMAVKFSSFLKAYNSWPFEFFARTMTEKLFHDDLKTEVIRNMGALETSKETNVVEQQKLFSELMQIANTALDLCRRTSNLSQEQMNQNGLNIESTGEDAPSSATIAQAREDLLYESYQEHVPSGGEYAAEGDWGESGGENSDLCWELQYEAEMAEAPLSPQEVDYCFRLESELESSLWERTPTEDEIQQINQSPTKRLCHGCGSQMHLVAQCPTRLQIIQQRTQRMHAQSGRQAARVPLGYSGGSPSPYQGSPLRSQRPRGSFQRARGPFPRGSSGSFQRPRGPFPGREFSGNSFPYQQTSQARSPYVNPYNPQQRPAIMGPSQTSTFFRS